MHTQSAQPKYLPVLTGAALFLAAIVVVTAILGMSNVIDINFTLAAVVLCGPPAFVLMLIADKV